MKGLFPDPALCASLSDGQIEEALDLLIDESGDPMAKAGFLDSLHRRGETSAELAGFARVLLRKSVEPGIERASGEPLLELCGTGGDRAGYLNISTAAMFVAAGAGGKVVKHGNRAFSSQCGSADVLEALGVNLHLEQGRVGEILSQAGCVFLLAADFHPAFASLAPLRRAMASEGKLTIFNLLGPLLNPAMPDFQLAGIYRRSMLPVYAEAMRLLGRKRAWAVHGEGSACAGIDEISILGPTLVQEISNLGLDAREFTIRPEDAGLKLSTEEAPLLGGDASTNAARILAILSGEETGAAADMILFNAGAALYLAGIGGTLAESVDLAKQSIASGSALASFEALRAASAIQS